MSWLDDMKADALELAHPGFVLQEGDEIHVKMQSREDQEWSSVTFEPGFYMIEVSVWRPTERRLGDSEPGQLIFRWMETGQHYYHATQTCYLNDAATEFFHKLMKLGSQR